MRWREGERVVRLVDAPQAFSRAVIVIDPGYFDVGDVLPRPNGMVHTQGHHRVVGIAIGSGPYLPPLSRIRRSCPVGPPAVNKQLAEVPLAGFDLGKFHGPNLALPTLPAADLPAPAQHDLFARPGGVGDGVPIGS